MVFIGTVTRCPGHTLSHSATNQWSQGARSHTSDSVTKCWKNSEKILAAHCCSYILGWFFYLWAVLIYSTVKDGICLALDVPELSQNTRWNSGPQALSFRTNVSDEILTPLTATTTLQSSQKAGLHAPAEVASLRNILFLLHMCIPVITDTINTQVQQAIRWHTVQQPAANPCGSLAKDAMQHFATTHYTSHSGARSGWSATNLGVFLWALLCP